MQKLICGLAFATALAIASTAHADNGERCRDKAVMCLQPTWGWIYRSPNDGRLYFTTSPAHGYGDIWVNEDGKRWRIARNSSWIRGERTTIPFILSNHPKLSGIDAITDFVRAKLEGAPGAAIVHGRFTFCTMEDVRSLPLKAINNVAACLAHGDNVTYARPAEVETPMR